MSDLLDTINQQLEARLNELRPAVEEYQRLAGALRALNGVSASSAPARGRSDGTRRRAAGAGSGATRRRGRRRGSGARAQQLMELVRSQPGVTVSEAGRQLEVSANYLYRVVAQLSEDHQLRKQGRELYPVADSSSSATTSAGGASGAEASSESSSAA